jgi:hypothetical protein
MIGKSMVRSTSGLLPSSCTLSPKHGGKLSRERAHWQSWGRRCGAPKITKQNLRCAQGRNRKIGRS